MGCAGSPALTALQLMLPSPSTMIENVADTFKDKEEVRGKDSNGCSNYWVRKTFTKYDGPVCYNTCGKEISCAKN